MATLVNQECTNNELSYPSKQNRAPDFNSTDSNPAITAQTELDNRLELQEPQGNKILRQLRLPLCEMKATVYQLVHTPDLSQQSLGVYLGRICRQVDLADRAVDAMADWLQHPDTGSKRNRSGSASDI